MIFFFSIFLLYLIKMNILLLTVFILGQIIFLYFVFDNRCGYFDETGITLDYFFYHYKFKWVDLQGVAGGVIIGEVNYIFKGFTGFYISILTTEDFIDVNRKIMMIVKKKKIKFRRGYYKTLGKMFFKK